MKKALLLLSVVSLLFACGGGKTTEPKPVAVIPQPTKVTQPQSPGTFEISSKSGIVFDASNPEIAAIATTLVDRISNATGYAPSLNGSSSGSTIELLIDTVAVQGVESYKLSVTQDKAVISAATPHGLFYGIGTLVQLMPDDMGKAGSHKGETIAIAEVEIQDSPRFEWRGMMLDVARHFQPKEYIKKFIDILAYHKLNTFHWHLTDGIGWRIQIDKYPALTERGAWRKSKHETAPWIGFELSQPGDTTQRHGGFYTKDDIREIIDYAASKYITIVPEIEMPGHSEAVTFCYPEYLCDGAQPGAGVFCAGKDETFDFLQDIIDEVIDLFPGKYIHIGGDEVGKGQWAACKYCKQRKAKEGLKSEEELQSYFVGRMEDYITSKGRQMIGWDEIIEGGLSDGAAVMSWTGFEGGIKAANTQHDVVMSPIDYVYFDHYQGYNPFEPQGWGGYNGIARVYTLDPVPDGIAPENEKFIKGGQANLWTENIVTQEHIEYMLMPRMAALSEVLWSSTDNKDWKRFTEKLDRQLDRYQANDWNYAESSLTPMVKSQSMAGDGSLVVEIANELDGYPIRYTTDGSEPTVSSALYEKPITITTPSTLKASTFRHDKPVGYLLTVPNLLNKATKSKVIYTTPFDKRYNGGGDSSLVDNRYAIKRGDDKAWQGFEKQNMDLTVDMATAQQISRASLRFFQHIGSTSVMLPLEVIVSTSSDGVNFTEVARKAMAENSNPDGFVEDVEILFPKTEARYVKIVAVNRGTLAEGHPRRGDNAWVFTDEISID